MHPRRAALLSICLLFCAVAAAHAQDDGGVSFDRHGQELLESLYVPNLTHAPFSLTLATEWSRPLKNGGTYTEVNSRPVKRDSAGRIYQERWTLSPRGSSLHSYMTWIQIEDPIAHTYYECSPRQRICELSTAVLQPLVLYKPTPSGPLTSGRGSRLHEDLGAQYFAGVPTHLYRDTLTFNPGTYGNDLPMSLVREFRYSAELGINLTSIVDTPQFGKQNFTVTDIATTEPDPRFFLPPEGYTIVDRRRPPANETR